MTRKETMCRKVDKQAASEAAGPRCLSVCQLAKRWAVSPKKIRAMIRRGALQAIDLGFARRQLRITPEAVQEAESRMAVRKPTPRRRRRDDGIDPEVLRLLA